MTPDVLHSFGLQLSVVLIGPIYDLGDKMTLSLTFSGILINLGENDIL